MYPNTPNKEKNNPPPSPTSMESETSVHNQDEKKNKKDKIDAWVSTTKCERNQGSDSVFALTHHEVLTQTLVALLGH